MGAVFFPAAAIQSQTLQICVQVKAELNAANQKQVGKITLQRPGLV